MVTSDETNRPKLLDVLDAINRVFREAISCDTAEQLAQTCLDAAVRLTSSAFGFIGEVNAGGRLDRIAMTAPGWDACDISKQEAPEMLRNMEVRGVWSVVLNNGVSLITNDPAAHPASSGVPDGHPAIRCFLGVPLNHRGKTLGLIALANKKGGYRSPDQQAVEHLSVAMVETMTRKRLESALQDSEEKYRHLFEKAQVGMFRTSLDNTQVLEVNRKLCELVEASREELIGSPSVVRWTDRTKQAEMMRLLRERGRVTDFEAPIVTRSDQEKTWLLSVELSKDGGHIEGSVVDITERTQMQQELLRSNKDLEEFAYIASHDLQEPLRKIQAFGGRLREKLTETTDTTSQDYLDRMVSASERMRSLIANLLTYSRVTTKQVPFEPVDLQEAIAEVISDLEPRIQQKNGEVIVVGDLPAVEADPFQLRQVLANLVGNALKFHRPDVAPVVHVEGEIAGSRCLIRVRDNGIGIEDKYTERIFGVFQRLHGRSQYEGTGIGLAIVKKIVERHDGEIAISSEPGQGTTFTVTLPLMQRGGRKK